MSRDSESPAPASVGRMVSRLAMVALLAGAALAAQVQGRFTLGDTLSHVRQVQGSPEVREFLPSLGVEIWSWDNASITFDISSMRVIEWRDPSRVLRVELRPSLTSRDSVISLGDALSDVVRVHGTPWALTQAAPGRPMYLAYGLSLVGVGADSVVEGWQRRDDVLRIAAGDNLLAQARFGTPPSLGRVRTTGLGNPSPLVRD